MTILSLPSNVTPPASTRIAGFDVVRAFAALGVVLLHAAVPYATYPMPGLSWPVHDAGSPLVGICFWSIELFIMPLFLVLAGFLAWKTLDRHGPGHLIRHRGRRLLIPFLFGCLIVLPIDLHVWVLGWVTDGVVPLVKLRSFKFDAGIDRDLWGTAHLWFLPYLFLYIVVLAGLNRFTPGSVSKPPADRLPGRTMGFLGRRRWAWNTMGRPWKAIVRVFGKGPAAAAALATIALVCLWLRPEVVWGFQHSFAPVPSKWLYSGAMFFAGVLLAVHDPRLLGLHRWAGRLVAPAVLLVVAAVALGRWHLAGGENQLARATLVVLTVAAATTLVLAIIALVTRYVHRQSVAWQYIAAASFWVYLVHHPLLGLIHIDLKWYFPGTSPLIKWLLSFSLATLVSLLSYEGLVRRTRLGRWLGMSWCIPEKSTVARAGSIQPVNQQRHAA